MNRKLFLCLIVIFAIINLPITAYTSETTKAKSSFNTLFNDEKFLQAWQKVCKYNTDIKKSQLNLKKMLLQKKVTLSENTPKINLKIAYRLQQKTDPFSYSLIELSWILDNGTKRIKLLIDDINYKIAENSYKRLLTDTFLSFVDIYNECVFLKKKSLKLKEILEKRKEVLSTYKQKYKLNLVSRLFLEKRKNEFEKAAYNYEKTKLDFEIKYTYLKGFADNKDIEIGNNYIGNGVYFDKEILSLRSEKLLEKAISNRPDIKIKTLRINLLKLNHALILKNKEPYFYVYGGYEYIEGDIENKYITLSLNLNLYDGNKTKRKSNLLKQDIKLQLTELKGTRQKAISYIKQTIYHLLKIKKLLNLRKQDLLLQKEEYDYELLKNKEGASSLVDVADEFCDYINAKINLEYAKKLLATTKTRLWLSLGNIPYDFRPSVTN